MERFKAIDEKLNKFAADFKADIFTSGTTAYGVPPNKIEERRIVWNDGLISKAVIILPAFISKDYDSPLWDFFNLAWLANENLKRKSVPFWDKYLLTRVQFSQIENELDNLLLQSKINLEYIKIEHLK